MKASKPCPPPGTSVQVDWFGWLPEAKLNAFRLYASEFETRYLMLGVSLDEAIGLYKEGSFVRSIECAALTPALCLNLTGHLEIILGCLAEHTAHYHLVPSVAPLDPANFRGLRWQLTARKNMIVNQVLLTQSAQYLNKIAVLRLMIRELAEAYCNTVHNLMVDRDTWKSAKLWAAMNSGHYDLNTCLRESMILLKCFLRVMPEEELTRFQESFSKHYIPVNKLDPQETQEHCVGCPGFPGDA